ncbi:ArnT family glycosyltransferase [Massilia antarctica]|uniref:ArnT family glycosyltransferase n=1 Tax=Massilia antarctica TaxID=2765360 RepID=UPI0006BB7084|nr:glycosyl transferase [Massilia sp. H27-R4]MCY0913415.1 glycosyltransferase [Massilia sp. H27-R4]CUI09550.1 Probable inner membrane transmembrane protein [Janthinobacterium sp. CG23_2]CUU33336.1 Probable inner membrane transmembrane protein [Janthinobacterium sp. CG23_2]
MKPVRLSAAATLALPRWALFALGLLYILPGLIGRADWKDDAGSFGIMWTMAHGGISDWLVPNIAGMHVPDDGPLAFWLGALCIKLFGWLMGDMMAARMSTIGIFLAGTASVWWAAFHLGRRQDAQPLRLAFGGQPEPDDYGRTLADTAALIYLGCLGLLMFSHETLAVTLQGGLVAYFLYRAVRYVEAQTVRNAVLIGVSLGALVLTRGMLTPLTLLLALFLCTRFLSVPLVPTLRQLGLAVLTAALIAMVWVLPAWLMAPYGLNPVDAWLAWTARQIGLPSWISIKTFFRVGIWFFWPAWPFAGWAIYAWRRQDHLLHIVLPLFFVGALTLLILCDPLPENGDMLKLLPPLAIMAAFGLPTMKRGAINAIDWFSVMVLTMLSAIVWLFWIAKLTGWPAQLAKNVLKLLPGYRPEVGVLGFVVALGATIGWIALVHWRISRQPAVLWRAVVLSSGGLILLWVLLMTLFLPDFNYSKSYASVARQIAGSLPLDSGCINSNVGAPQRASLAFYGKLPFDKIGSAKCDLILLQDSVKVHDERELAKPPPGAEWRLLWEGRRPADRDERFRLYQRAP